MFPWVSYLSLDVHTFVLRAGSQPTPFDDLTLTLTLILTLTLTLTLRLSLSLVRID